MPMSSRRLARIVPLAAAGLLLLGIADPSSAAPPHGSFHEWLLGRGRVGIRVQPLSPELREHFGAPEDRGVLVSEVEKGRPAEKGGLLVGDVIVAVDGTPIDSPGRLAGIIRRAPNGGSLALQVVRKGEKQTLQVAPDDPTPLLDDEAQEWMERFGRHLEEGGEHFERRLEELERRLEELQREFEQRLRELEGVEQKT